MPILMIIALVLMVIAMVVSIIFRPKPIPPFAAGLSDFQVPSADTGRPVPVIFGTVLIKGPNVVWYGDMYADPVPAPSGGSSGGGGGGS